MTVRTVLHLVVIEGQDLAEMPFGAIDEWRRGFVDVSVKASLFHPDFQRLRARSAARQQVRPGRSRLGRQRRQLWRQCRHRRWQRQRRSRHRTPYRPCGLCDWLLRSGWTGSWGIEGAWVLLNWLCAMTGRDAQRGIGGSLGGVMSLKNNINASFEDQVSAATCQS